MIVAIAGELSVSNRNYYTTAQTDFCGTAEIQALKSAGGAISASGYGIIILAEY